MRGRRRKTEKSVFIDLTSLLDVIFILLLVVMCGYNYEKQKNVEDLAREKEAMSAAISEAEANSRAYSDMIDTQSNLQKYVWTASIVVPYDPNDITKRQIRVLREDTEIIAIDLIGNDGAKGMDTLRNTLSEYIETHKDIPVIISLNDNDDKILYRDEKAIKKLLDELASSYGNVSILRKQREPFPVSTSEE